MSALNFDTLLEKYRIYLCRERRYAANTVETYSAILTRYAAFVKGGGISSVESPQPAELQSYLEGLRARRNPEKRLRPRTLAMHVDVLRLFYNWLASQDDGPNVTSRAVLQLERPKIDEELLCVLSRDEMANLLDAPRAGRHRQRDKAILEVLYSTACRVSELTHMKMQDLDLNEGKIKCTVKGGGERFPFLGRYAAAAVILYLAGDRPRLVAEQPHSQWLFVSPQRGKGGQLNRASIHCLIGRYSRQIGLKANVSPHTIRRTAATHLLLSGCDVRTVMEYLGHASVAATQRYLNLDYTHLIETHSRCHPHGVNGHPPGDGQTGLKQLTEVMRLPDAPDGTSHNDSTRPTSCIE